MKARVDCIPCIFRQTLITARHVTDDPRVLEQVLRKVAEAYSRRTLHSTPAHFSQAAYEIISEETGVADPFAEEKKKFNKLVLSMVPECRAALEASDDPLETGAHLAVAGNIIDLGIGAALDIHSTLASALEVPFTINDIEKLRADLGRFSNLLYLGDNAGEIVFDMLFIEVIKKLFPDLRVRFSVKSGPIINDATMEDAVAVGMTDVCEVIETGGAYIGAPLDKVSRDFIDAFRSADIIIAKGHGNFETLSSETGNNIYFILKAKCELVAKELGVSVGDSVLKSSKTSVERLKSPKVEK